jgi:protein-disulfide isomerase
MAATPRVKQPPPTASAGSSPRRFYALVGGLLLAGGGLLYFLVRQPKDVSIPANVTILAADTAGFRGYVLGSDSAQLEVAEYADYQCPACQQFAVVQFPAVRRTLIETGLVRWRFRDFPLAQHPHARLAAHSAACAGDQGKYWEQQDQIFVTHPEWSVASSAGPIFRESARRLGLDLAAYDACMASAKYAGRIQASLEEGARLGVGSTPTFLIGSRLYPGQLSSDSLAALVKALASVSSAPQ